MTKFKKRFFAVVIVAGLCICGILFAHHVQFNDVNTTKTVTIYYVRHGLTDTNLTNQLYGQEDVPRLTEEGIQMALNVGRNLSDIPFASIYVSPLTRTEQTAQCIMENLGDKEVRMIPVDSLMDISWGNVEGMTWDEVTNWYHVSSMDECLGTVTDADFVSPVGAESKYAFVERFTQAVNEIIAESEDQDNIIVVSHSAMSFYFQSIFPEQGGEGVDNCSVTIVQYVDGKPILIDYNNTMYRQ